jgi:uncharacterized protein YjdB/cell wall-associated NlpC family hydrolase
MDLEENNMTNIRTKTISTLLVLTLILSVFTVFTPQKADAVSFSTGYPNTYVNTGAGANDIVGVARTQIGYQENSGGTKYGYWYNPSFANQPWCAMFVSWCAAQAKISNDVIKRFSSCSVSVAWWKSIGRWQNSRYYGGSYTPQKGDIVFYRDGGSSAVSTHVGIMVGINGNYLNVIEGNATNAKVCQFTSNSSRTLTSSYVIGYGLPNYKRTVTEESSTFESWEVTADALSLRSSYSTSSSKLGSITIGNIIEVTQFKVNEGYLWGYTTFKNAKGWCALNYCNYIEGNIKGVYYQLPPTMSPTLLDMYVNQSKTPVVTNGLGAKFTSSAPNVVKVSTKGKMTAVSPGTAVITCQTSTGKATCTVTVNRMNINKNYTEVCAGEYTTLKVVGTNSKIVWKSKNPAIASVGSTGKVKGNKVGKTYVVAKVSGTKFRCDIKVTKTPTTYERFTSKKKNYLRSDSKTKKKLVLVPKYKLLKVTKVKYTDTYTWGKTKYRGKKGWVVLNYYKYKLGTIGGKKLKPKAFLNKKKKSMYITTKFELKPKFTTGTVTFVSDDKSIAKVSKKGVITAVKEGKTYVRAKYSKKSLKCKVTVKNPKLSETSLDLFPAKTAALSVKGGTGSVKWTSSNPSVAKVSPSGVVTSVSCGSAEITAVKNKIKLKCNVMVVDPELESPSETIKVGENKQIVLKDFDPAKTTWKSSNESIVKVSSTGVITGIAAGEASITIVSNEVTLHCEVLVKK